MLLSKILTEVNTEDSRVIDDVEHFKSWLKQKNDISKAVERVCKKYGQTLRKKMSMEEIIYDSEHDLLFCRNAKVCYIIFWL